MAATNFTPIILYHTTTASATPSAGNLNNGELAINITDGKLFYKDNGGTVQVIATKGTGTIGGSNTQVQYNSSGALAGSANFTFNGTTATINTLNLTNALGTTFGGTGLNAYTTGDLVYASGTNTLAKLGIGLNTYILTSTGSVPQWSAPSAVTVATANNLAGGAAGSVPYQSGASTTTFLSIGTQNQVLTSTGSAPQWSSGLTLTTLATTGNTTLGDAAADNLTVNATITSNLIFTDNTYDIGASGATRPRTIYAGTSIFSPLVDTTNLEVTNIKALDGTAAASIANGTGVISITANPVFSGGTANGVLYLNGSKVATSGSALTFDGTTFTHTGASNFATSTGSVGVGTASPNGRLQVAGTFASQNNIVSITSSGVGSAATGAVRALYVNAQTANTASSVYGVFSEVTYTNSQTNYGGYFSAGDPTGNSYGVYGLAAQTDVNGPGTAYGGYFKATAALTGTSGITYGARVENAGAVGNSAYGLTVSTVAGATTVVPFQVIHAGSDIMRINSAGRLGVGVNSPIAFIETNTTTPGTGFIGVRVNNYSGGVTRSLYAGCVDDTDVYLGSSFYQNSGNYQTDRTSGSFVNFAGGAFSVATNSGLTANTPYSPTTRFTISATGRATFNNGDYTCIVGSVFGKTPATTGFSFGYNPSGGLGESQLVWGTGGATFPFIISSHDGSSTIERGRFSSDGTFRVKGAGTAGSTDAVQFSGSAPASSLIVDSSGYIGRGGSPGRALDISAASSVDTTGAVGKWTANFRDTTATAATGVGGGLLFQGLKSTAGSVGNFGAIAGLKENSTNGNEDGYLGFYTVPNSTGLITERARFNSTGALVFAGGTTTANGIGITFPATQSASSNANTLDDYEEGTFTMTCNPSGGFTPTSNTSTGYYTKIGNVVVVTGNFSMTVPSSLGSYSNDNVNFAVLVGGLPFTISSAGSASTRSVPVLGVGQNMGTTNGYLAGHGSEGTTDISIFQNKDSGGTRTSPNLFVSTIVNYHIEFTYFTA